MNALDECGRWYYFLLFGVYVISMAAIYFLKELCSLMKVVILG